MKIALVVPGGVDRSGESRVIPALLALIRRLAARHEVHVFALAQEPQPGKWMLYGAHVHNIGSAPAGIRQAKAVFRIVCESRVGRFDVVHSIWAGGCGLVAVLAGKLLGVPSIVHVAGGELISLPQIKYGGRSTWKGRASASLVLRGATAITAASTPMLEQIASLGHAAHRVPLGVDLEFWPPCPPRRRDTQAPVRLIHIASLNRVKDQTTLLRALSILSAQHIDFYLDLVGEDTLAGEIQALARQLGLTEKIAFHGFLTQTQLRPVLQRAHVNVVSSLHEAGPLVVLEAAVLGVPTAGTAVGHIKEWAPEAALAVPPADAAGLAAMIKRLAEGEDLRLRLAAEAARRALAEDTSHTCARFEQLYLFFMTIKK